MGNMLDVGCGYGQSLVLWEDYFRDGALAENIVGVNYGPDEVALARETTLRDHENIKLIQGDACDADLYTKLRNDHGSFDLAVSIDAAYHFNPSRACFFQNVFPLLQPDGGALAMVDIVMDQPPSSFGVLKQFWFYVICWAAGVPPANFAMTITDYKESLHAAGFVDVSVFDITEFVFPGFVWHTANQRISHEVAWTGKFIESAAAFLDLRFVIATARR